MCSHMLKHVKIQDFEGIIYMESNSIANYRTLSKNFTPKFKPPLINISLYRVETIQSFRVVLQLGICTFHFFFLLNCPFMVHRWSLMDLEFILSFFFFFLSPETNVIYIYIYITNSIKLK